MKINFQKLLSIIVAVAISSMALSFAVSAENGGQTHGGGGRGGDRTIHGDTYAAFLRLLDGVMSGQISSEEFAERYSNLIGSLNEDVASSLGMGYIGDIYSKMVRDNTYNTMTFPLTVQERIRDLFNKYTQDQQQSTVDKQGYGCLAVFYPYKDSSDMMYKAYGEYGTYTVDENGFYRMTFYGNGKRDYYYNDVLQPSGTTTWNYESYQWSGYYPQFYGDWRNNDGTSIPTDDEFETVGVLDLDTHPDGTPVTDDELFDMLKNILGIMESEMPDFSSVEDILKAIYFKLDNLGAGGKCDCASLINSAINQLASENKASNEKLIKLLQDLKGKTNLDEIKKTLEKLVPDIDDMSKTELVHAAIMSRFSFIEELKTVIKRFISSYANAPTDKAVISLNYKSNGSLIDKVFTGMLNSMGYFDIDFSGNGAFDEYMPKIRGLIAAFVYVSYAWNTYRKIPLYISGGGE